MCDKINPNSPERKKIRLGCIVVSYDSQSFCSIFIHYNLYHDI